MAIPQTAVYVSSERYLNNITAWGTGAKTVGTIVKQTNPPGQGNERAFICITAGTTGSVQPTFNLGKGVKTTDNTVVWMEITGVAAFNGDSGNVPTWSQILGLGLNLGQVIKNNAANNYFICVTAGSAGISSEPAWNFTLGSTTTDSTITWECLGPISNYSGIWKAPHARVENALSNTGNWMFPGDICYVDANHSQTSANSLQIWSAGSQACTCQILSVSNSAAPPTSLLPGANINISQANTILFYGGSVSNTAGHTIFDGINFTTNATGTAVNFQNPSSMIFRNCNFTLYTPNTSSTTIFFQNEGPVFWQNTRVSFNGNSGSQILFGEPCGVLDWSYTPNNAITLANGTNWPATAIINSWFGSAPISVFLDCRGVDFSAVGTNFLVGTALGYYKVNVSDCEFQSGKSLLSAGFPYTTQPGTEIHMVRCDFGGSDTTSEQHFYYNGRIVGNTSMGIYRSSGAAYPSSGNVCWFIDMTGGQALYSVQAPVSSPWIYQWNETTGGPVTANVYFAQNNSAAALTQEKIWLELEYLGTSGSLAGSLVTTQADTLKSLQGTVANSYPTDSTSTWNGLTTPTKQVMSVTFTPQNKGPIRARVCVAANTVKCYVDPLIVIH